MWHVMPSSLVEGNPRFGRICCLQGTVRTEEAGLCKIWVPPHQIIRWPVLENINLPIDHHETLKLFICPCEWKYCFLGLLFNLEDGGKYVVCNVSFTVCVASCAVFCLSGALFCVMCLIVVSLPPGRNPFAVNLNNKTYVHFYKHTQHLVPENVLSIYTAVISSKLMCLFTYCRLKHATHQFSSVPLTSCL
jgi:hypothetical protein